MAGIFEAINSTLADHQFNKVTKIRLIVGKFTNAQPAALEFAFQAFAQGTKIEGAELEIEEVPVTGYCTVCNHEFEIEHLAFRCPKCHDFNIKIVKGRELILESLEVE